MEAKAAKGQDPGALVLHPSHKSSPLWISDSSSIKWGIREAIKNKKKEVIYKVPSNTENV